MDEKQQVLHPEFQYKWFSKEELMQSDDIIQSDKVMINNFYYQKKENYLKLDCDRDKEGKYFWK